MSESFWNARPVLVTGATGLVGGWLVRRLLEEGAAVVALVREGSPGGMLVRDGLVRQVSVVQGSLQDPDLLRQVLAGYSVQTIFHLAAQPLVHIAKKDPAATLKINVEGTWNILEAARQTGVGQTVVASSDKAYGAGAKLPTREHHPLAGRFPYDVSKSCADLISTMYAHTYGLPVAILRCANLFGGGDLNFSRTIPGVIRSTLEGRHFHIRSDGKFVRDFLYVKDAVQAYLTAASELARRPELAGEAFNISLSVRLTVLDVVSRVLALMGRADLEPVIENQASAETREQYMACAKARKLLGWRPRYSMDEGLRETIDWYTSYFSAPAAESLTASAGTDDPWNLERVAAMSGSAR